MLPARKFTVTSLDQTIIGLAEAIELGRFIPNSFNGVKQVHGRNIHELVLPPERASAIDEAVVLFRKQLQEDLLELAKKGCPAVVLKRMEAEFEAKTLK